ncbi:MAG: hypothetical protein ACRETD_01880, partial [Steroidobacteraceae bacterium]
MYTVTPPSLVSPAAQTLNCRTLPPVEYANTFPGSGKMRLIFAACLLFLATQINAEQSASPLSSIRVTGQSTVTAQPDRARIDIGVETHAPQS